MRSALTLITVLILATTVPHFSVGVAKQIVVLHDDGSAEVYVYVRPVSGMINLSVVAEPIAVDVLGCANASVYAGNKSIVVYVPNCSRTVIRYVTVEATSKNGSVWIFSIRSPYPTTVVLPRDALPIDVEPSPSPAVVNGSPALSFPPGTIVLKYVEVPSYMVSQNPSISSSIGSNRGGEVRTQPTSSAWMPSEGTVVGILAATLAGAAIGLKIYRSASKSRRIELDEIDRRIVEVLRSRGELTAREIMELTRIPKSTLYRRLAKLRERGVIESVVKSGTTFYRLRIGET